MALATPGPIIGGISGTIGSVTFRNTPRGLVIAQHARKLDRATPTQTRRQAVFMYNHQRWSAFPAPAKQIWTSFGRSVTTKNRLGVSVHPSGRELFVKLNVDMWDPQYNPGSHSPSEDAPISNTQIQLPTGTSSWTPRWYFATVSATTGIHTQTEPDPPPGEQIYEFMDVSLWCRQGQTSTPTRWIRLGRQPKDATALDWTPWIYRLNFEASLGQTFGYRLRWMNAGCIPTRWYTGITTLTV